jgi:hypothetical protein
MFLQSDHKKFFGFDYFGMVTFEYNKDYRESKEERGARL